MKLNVLIRKRQLILAGLVVVLGVAVYLNWEFSRTYWALESKDSKGAVITAKSPKPKAYTGTSMSGRDS